MATVTAGALISAGLRRAGKRDSATGFIQHPASGGGEAFDYLNAAIGALFDILMEADQGFKAGSSVNFVTSAGVAALSLGGLYRTSKFMFVPGTVTGAAPFYGREDWKTIERIHTVNIAKYQTRGEPQGYDPTDTGVTLYPTPDGVYTVQVFYSNEPIEVTADATNVDVKGPWREFVEKHFAISCLQKAKEDTADLKVDLWGPSLDGKGGLAQRIREGAHRRDSAPMRPIDVMGDDGPNGLPPFGVWTG